MPRIRARLLVPGRGEPIRDAIVSIVDGKIDQVGPYDGGDHALAVPVLMPGLWDVHVHLVGIRSPAEQADLLTLPTATAAGRAVKDLERMLRAGFTGVRDLGGHGVRLAGLVDEGTVNGPAVHGSGAVIGPTGGHADPTRFPHRWVRERDEILRLADGVDDCTRAVREQLRRGAKVIMVSASGGVTSAHDDPGAFQYSERELRAIVQEAARADRVVAANCHGKTAIMAALAAGCRTIERGSHLDAEAAEAMLANDAVFVPTRTVIEGILEAGLASTQSTKAKTLAGRHLTALRTAHGAGVRIATGSGLGLSTEGGPLSFGANASELVRLVHAGLSPLAAIEAATANGPATLGPQGPRSGQVRPGFDADLIALDSDPTADISVLAVPDRITHVWRRGEMVKTPPG